MEILSENNNILAVSIPITVIFVIASMIYTIRNISRIWRAGNPEKSEVSGDESETDVNEDIPEKENEVGENKIDPVQYCEHIQSEVKKARHRVATQEIRQKLTEEDMENEREIQRKQIEDIFKLMEQNSDKFGVASEDDVVQQMKLYV